MKTFATPTLYDEMELPSDLSFLLDYDHQPNFSEEHQLMSPESYLLQDFNLINTFVPLADLMDVQTSDTLNVTILDKSNSMTVLERQEEAPGAAMLPKVEVIVEEDEFCDQDKAEEPHVRVRRKRFNCGICKYHAQQPDALKIHMETFHGESRPFKCNQCVFVTVGRSDFMSHLITHHKQERYSCDQCDYGTNRMFLMKLHMMTHSGEIPFKCSECDYSTLYKKKLKEHMWLHSNDRPFKCTLCHYVGLNSKSLSYHVAKKHKLKS